MKIVQAVTIGALAIFSTPLFAKQVVCVFDPVGKAGDAFALAKLKTMHLKQKNGGLTSNYVP